VENERRKRQGIGVGCRVELRFRQEQALQFTFENINTAMPLGAG